MTFPQPMTLIHAVARMEGYYVPGSRPNRNNNPGDLEYHSWMSSLGGKLEPDTATQKGRFAIFPSEDQGFTALKMLFSFPLYKGKTLTEVFNTYAPQGENLTNEYLENVCEWTGASPDTIIDTLL
jgi:hypothetical protein